MERKNQSVEESDRTPSSAKAGAASPTTQRAYTLRLRPALAYDEAEAKRVQRRRELGDSLWATHDAVNRGTRAFGDWLLTLRGGLSHGLAEPVPSKGGERTAEETAAIRRQRRILLALSWFSVEDERGAPMGAARIASGRDADSVRRERIVGAFRAVLEGRGITGSEAERWLLDCTDSLVARIREDAVWINRSGLFDTAVRRVGDSLTRDEVWDLFTPFFGGQEAYFAGVVVDGEEDADVEDKAKDLVQKAGQWLSSRFGEGKGADFESMSRAYDAMAAWADAAPEFASSRDALTALVSSLKDLGPLSADSEGILGLISGPGYKSASRNLIKQWDTRPAPITRAELTRFAEVVKTDAAKARANVGGKGRRPWSDHILESVEAACGFTYLQEDGPARHAEFAVMLDHAARRVSIGHSWVKRAEAERQRFETHAALLEKVPADARRVLDAFVRTRSDASGATAAGGEYRIRRRAIEGWKEVVQRWGRASCRTREDRVLAVRDLQSDPEIEKFGDGQLFEALAEDGMECVWRQGQSVTETPLVDYTLGNEARDKRRRFKVPAYRHPDPLRHPVFCDFGNSRWKIRYAVHEAAKHESKARAKASQGGKPGAPRASDAEAVWRGDRYGLRMGLWTGAAQQDVELRWSSKRLTRDLGLASSVESGHRSVARADRLGRAAAGVGADEKARAEELFNLADWNGRLQAPRVQLDALADWVEKHGWDASALAMRARIKWLVSFSAKLSTGGPFHEYIATAGGFTQATPFVSGRSGELGIKQPGNDKRGSLAKLGLSRLPGLRVLGVDLGHRFAAACAVWDTLSKDELVREIEGRTVVGGGVGAEHLFLHVRHRDPNTGRERTSVYRRLAADELPDGAAHPAPWARLGRQFLIKLQGEEQPARKSLDRERAFVERLERGLGRVRSADDSIPSRVDGLMSHAVRVARLGLRRLGDAARIAYAFSPDAVRLAPGGAQEPLTVETRAALLVDALVLWGELGHDGRWVDDWASRAWSTSVGCEFVRVADDATRLERQVQRAENERRLGEVAKRLAGVDNTAIFNLWNERWKAMDAEWRPRLRELRDWLLPRGLRARQDDNAVAAAERAARRTAARGVGGLSLDRIATIRELYQLQKAYAMRPTPRNLRQNIAGKGDDRFDEFGRSVLAVMERLREQRVKQISSRIVEAALGVGRLPAMRGRDMARPKGRVDRPCQVVVIENLKNYRPDEVQTRRENRALMNWSAAKVRKHLEESCQLHGLLMREVTPNYTSRQCSRTGRAGMRCTDVRIDPKSGCPDGVWWDKMRSTAERKIDEGGGSALDRMVVDLARALDDARRAGRKTPPSVRLPRQGGDLFVAAPAWNDIRSPRAAVGGAIQADLNAAANIGLRALLDPDFPGRWWYIPCSSATGQPGRDKCVGAACIDLSTPLLEPQLGGERRSSGRGTRGASSASANREFMNAWGDPTAADIGRRAWRSHGAYWNDVTMRVVELLRTVNDLSKNTA